MEFALVFPILALVLFSIIDFGIAFNDYQSLRQGAREGARQAVVNDWSGGEAACSSGTPDQQLVCLTKLRTGVSGTAVHVVVTNVDPTDPSPSYKDYNVKVCVAKPISSVSGFTAPFIGNRVLKSSIEMRAETDLSLAAGSYGDAAPSGQTWSSLCGG